MSLIVFVNVFVLCPLSSCASVCCVRFHVPVFGRSEGSGSLSIHFYVIFHLSMFIISLIREDSVGFNNGHSVGSLVVHKPAIQLQQYSDTVVEYIVHIYKCTLIHSHVYTYACIHTYTQKNTQTNSCTHTDTGTQIQIHIYTHAETYLQTETHAHKLTSRNTQANNRRQGN